MRYALILLLALAGSVRGDDCQDCIDACAPDVTDVCTECYGSSDECYDVCTAQHGQEDIDAHVAAGCPPLPPDCMLDCIDDDTASAHCHLLDTCLDDCEYPIGEPGQMFWDHQSLYDAFYTALNCAFKETASAWCTCVRSLTSLSLISHLLPPTRP